MNTMTDERALAALAQAIDKIGRDNGTTGNFDHTLWGAGTEAIAHLSSVVGERNALRITEQHLEGSLEIVRDRAERAEAELALYRRTINEIDDRTEYRSFTRADISEILARLTAALAPKDSSHE